MTLRPMVGASAGGASASCTVCSLGPVGGAWGIDEKDELDQAHAEGFMMRRNAVSGTRSGKVRELEGVLHDAAGRLSPAHVAALVAHPDAVRSALAVAADVLSVDDAGRRDGPRSEVETIEGAEPGRIGAGEADRRLAARTCEGRPETLMTSDELAARVGLKTRQSVHDWLKKGKIVGWPGAKRGYVFPAAQFDDRGRPIAGLDRVVRQFDDGYAAWVWLTTGRASLDGAEPLTLLAGGETDRVAKAAEGDKQGDFA